MLFLQHPDIFALTLKNKPMKKSLSFRLLAIVFAGFMALSAYAQSDTVAVCYALPIYFKLTPK